jgi:hypothetical protein
MLAHMLCLSSDDTGMVQALVHPPKGERPLGLASFLSVEDSSRRQTESIDRGVCPCVRRLTCCHGNHGDYVCSFGRVTMSGGDGMDVST